MCPISIWGYLDWGVLVSHRNRIVIKRTWHDTARTCIIRLSIISQPDKGTDGYDMTTDHVIRTGVPGPPGTYVPQLINDVLFTTASGSLPLRLFKAVLFVVCGRCHDCNCEFWSANIWTKLCFYSQENLIMFCWIRLRLEQLCNINSTAIHTGK